MGENIQLVANDGFTLAAYRSAPSGEPRACVLVVQEIFGVNGHIREVCDGFAADGFLALAPAIFDRAQRGVELGYEEEDMQAGFACVTKLKPELTAMDLQTGINEIAKDGKVGVVGYCYGGTLAWLCACNAQNVSCAVGYYGGQIAQHVDLTPKVPTILHFGELDAHIPMSDVKKVDEAHPDVPVYVYNADHGFNCNHRASYNEAAANEARERTMLFFGEHLT